MMFRGKGFLTNQDSRQEYIDRNFIVKQPLRASFVIRSPNQNDSLQFLAFDLYEAV